MIIYSLIARGTTVLTEHTNATGNFTSIAIQILEKLDPSVPKMTLVYDDYLFHYVHIHQLTFMCMCDSKFGRRIPFAFLEDISSTFWKLYGTRTQLAVAYGLNEFRTVLEKQMVTYSAAEADKFKQVQGEIEQVKDVMVQNIEKVLERGERIEILVDKTDNLNQASFAFKKRSTALRRSMWWKNQKLVIMMVSAAILGVYFIVGSFCGLPGWSACTGNK
jgi:vesicle-associated membrane protein 7